MHILLTKLLNKRKVKREDLDAEERKWFDEKEKILSGGDITLDTVQKFCEAQIALIESQFKNLENETKKNERLIIMHNVYSSLKNVMSAPAVERAVQEEYLNKLIRE